AAGRSAMDLYSLPEPGPAAALRRQCLPADREEGGVSCPDPGAGPGRVEYGLRPGRALLRQAGRAALPAFPGPGPLPAGTGTGRLAVGLGLRGDRLDEPRSPEVGRGDPGLRPAAENPGTDLRGDRSGTRR